MNTRDIMSVIKRPDARTTMSAALAVIALVAFGCGSSSNEASPSASSTAAVPDVENVLTSGFVNGGDDVSGTPTSGGSLTMGVFSETNSLDPVVSFGTGYAGGTEMIAIFDVLMRYDVETGEYKPQMAESLTANSDSTTWTLKLRPNVSFSDGTALDANVVKSSLDRHAAKGRSGFLIKDNVTSISVSDPLTVEFQLNKSWTGFPYVLSFHPGMITPPSADAAGDAFGKAPVGAGAYVVERYAPGEEIVLRARADYWGGKPPIETLRFKPLVGAQPKLDALQSQTFDLAFLGDPKVSEEAMDAGLPGYLRISYGQGATIFNIGFGSERPTTDLKIRAAVAHATNPDMMNERVWAGAAIPSAALYGPGSRWFAGVDGTTYDPDKAKALVEEAKQDGWDGHIQVVITSSPPWGNAALAVQAMLQAVGFTVDLEQPPDILGQTQQVNIEHRFDLTTTGYALDESAPYVEMAKKFGSASPQNIGGYKSETMDDLLLELAAAKSDDAVREVMGEIQSLVNQDQPSVVWSSNPELLAWNDNVHGVLPSVNAMLILSKAWIS